MSTSSTSILSCARSFLVAGTGPMPITRGATPAEATPTTRALIVKPSRTANRSDAMIMAAAPSLIPEELPAVTVPPGRNTGLSLASCSSVVSGRSLHRQRDDFLGEASLCFRTSRALLAA